METAAARTGDRRRAWRVLWRVACERRLLVGSVTLIGCLEIVPTAVLPLVLGAALDGGVVGGDVGVLGGQVGLLLALGAAMVLGGGLGNYLGGQLWLHAATSTEEWVHDHAALTGAAIARRVRGGEVATVGATDVDRVAELMESLGRITGSLLAFVVVAVLLFGRSPLLAGVVLVGVPLAVLGIGPLVRPLQNRQARQRDHLGEAATMAADIVGGLRILRGIGGERVFAARFAETSQRVRTAGVAVGRVDSWLAGAEVLLPGLVTVVITWLGARLVLDHVISTGELFAFFAVASYLVVPVGVATAAIDHLTSALVAAGRADGVLSIAAEPAEPAHPVDPPPPGMSITDETTGLVLEGGKLTVVATDTADAADAAAVAGLGARVARLAAPGSGGRVLADGVDLAEVSPAALRGRILFSGNDDRLFSGPARDEIGPEPAAALRAAQATEVLDHLPDGLLDERGRALSGGQRQRLLLARALCADPEVLVLDEPTSAVDAHTEARIASAVAELRGGRTTVVITDSPLWTEVADVVLRPGAAVLR